MNATGTHSVSAQVVGAVCARELGHARDASGCCVGVTNSASDAAG